MEPEVGNRIHDFHSIVQCLWRYREIPRTTRCRENHDELEEATTACLIDHVLRLFSAVHMRMLLISFTIETYIRAKLTV